MKLAGLALAGQLIVARADADPGSEAIGFLSYLNLINRPKYISI